MRVDMNRKHNGKTFKKPYRKSRVFDKTCRSHGGCPACYANRMYSTWKRIANAEDTKEEEKSDLHENCPMKKSGFSRTIKSLK